MFPKRNRHETRLIYPVVIGIMTMLIFQPAFSGNHPDYKQEFGDKYSIALKYIIEQPEWGSLFKKNNIDPAFAVAIVFPEIVRYSVICDKIEIAGLQTLYVQYGTSYADFSVGRFQMKPSFAQSVEADYYILKDSIFKGLSFKFDTTNTPDARIARLKRLSSTEGQMTYLMLFIHIMEHRYINYPWKTVYEKLRLFATAYNFGYKINSKKLFTDTHRKTFHTGIISGRYVKKYCYANISCDFMKNYKGIF